MPSSLASVFRMNVLPKSGHANTGSVTSLTFTSTPLRSRSLSALTMRAQFGTKRRYHEATPRYCLSLRTVEGGCSRAMAATLSESVLIPWLVTRCPRYSSSCLRNWHLSGFILRFAFFRRRNPSRSFSLCSCWVRLITIMSSWFANACGDISGPTTCFTAQGNVADAEWNPNGITIPPSPFLAPWTTWISFLILQRNLPVSVV